LPANANRNRECKSRELRGATHRCGLSSALVLDTAALTGLLAFPPMIGLLTAKMAKEASGAQVFRPDFFVLKPFGI